MKNTTAKSPLPSRNTGKHMESAAPQLCRIEPLEARIAPAAILITPETEANNTFATANALTLSPVAGASGAINPSGDVDFYSFSVNVGDRLWIATDTGGTQNAGATSRDSVLDLLASDGTTVLENDDDDGTGNGGDGTLETTLSSLIAGKSITTSGTHFVRVRGFGAAIVDPYTLLVARTTAADESAEVEANGTAATANSIIPAGKFVGVRKGAINAAGDVDYYSFTANVGQRFFFVGDGDPERDGTGTDLVLEVRGAADTLVLSVNASGSAGGSSDPVAEGANFVATASGTYYVKVRHASGSGTGTYDLMVANGSTPPGPTIFGVTAADHLVSFYGGAPGSLLTDVAVTGLQASERLEAVEFRPATGQLYGLGITDVDAGPDSGRILTINPTTGAVSPVGGGAPFSTTLIDSSQYGFDFNPTVDRIRIVNDNDQNLRANPNDGTLAGTDIDLTYPAAGDPNSGNSATVVAVAYDRSGGGPALTTLFGYDFTNDALVRIGGVDGTPSPNGGVLTTIGTSGFVATNSAIGLDIDPGSGTAFLSARVGGIGSLYTVNLANGLATSVGVIGAGGGTDVRSLTVASNTLVVAGTGGDDTLVVTATGANTGSYTLNGGAPVPFAGISAFTFSGGLGNDLLQVNNPAGGLFAPSGGIFYNGQGQSGTPGDRLEILGGAHTTETHTFAVDSPAGQHNGGITLVNGATVAIYAYTGLSPILVNAGTPADIIFNLPAGTNPDAVIGDDGGADDPDATQDAGSSAISGSTFEFTQFVNPSNSLTINGTGTNSDTITLKAMDAAFLPAGATPFLIATGAGTDTIHVQATTASIGTTVRGGSEDDVMNVSSDAPTNTGTLDGILGNLRFEGDGGSDTLNVSDLGSTTPDLTASITNLGGNITQLAGFAPANIQYTDPLYSNGGLENLNVFGGSGGNIISVNDTTASIRTTLDSGAGNDAVTIAGDHLSASNLFGGGAGNDRVVLNVTMDLGATSVFPITGLEVRGDGPEGDTDNRDTLTVNDESDAARDLVFDYDTSPTFSGDVDIAGLSTAFGVKVRTLETLLYNGAGAASTDPDNDSVRVVGTFAEDVLTAVPLSLSEALIFIGGNPWGGPNAFYPFSGALPGVAGGSSVGPDIRIDGISNTALTMGGDDVIFAEDFDTGVAASALPTDWTTTSLLGAINWTTQTATVDSAPNAAFLPDIGGVSDTALDSPSFAVGTGASQLTFRHKYDFEFDAACPPDGGCDGGVLEISYNGGAFQDILAAGGSFVAGGYNGTISTDAGQANPLTGRPGWILDSAGFITTTVNLPESAAGQAVQMRWRFGSDLSGSDTGWQIDDVRVQSTGFVGDVLFVYGTSETDLSDATTGLDDDHFGFGAGVIIPGFGAGHAFDTISVDDTLVSITNHSAGPLLEVHIATASFLPAELADPLLQFNLIVNSGFETNPDANGIADDISAVASNHFGIKINGGDPDPANPVLAPFQGDRLTTTTTGAINIYSDEQTVTINSAAASSGLGFSSIENITFTADKASQVVNLIGNYNAPSVEQEDTFVINGYFLLPNNQRADVDANLAPIPGAQNEFQPDTDGDNEFFLSINGSSPIGFRNVRTVNVFGSDQNPPPGTESSGPNDEDTLDVTPYADNSSASRQWDIGINFDEGNPSPGGKIILRGVPGVPETVVFKKNSPESGVITDSHATTHVPIAIINYQNVSIVQFLKNAGDGDATAGSGFGTPGSNANPFSTATIYDLTSFLAAPGYQPTAVVTGDLNSDGFEDIVVVNTKSKNLSILINKGDGTFFDPVNIPSGGKAPRDVVIGDFDSNAGLDLVVSNPGSSNIAFLSGHDDGTFEPATLTLTPKFKPYALATADIDGDNALDVVATSYATSAVEVLLGSGAGFFTTSAPVPTVGKKPIDVVIADFDDDGTLDVATANNASKNVSFFKGLGGGALGAAQRFAAGLNPTGLAAGDLDNDGIPDLAVSNLASRFASVLLSAGGALLVPQFAPQLRIAVPGQHNSTSIVIADFDGNGIADLGLGNRSNPNFTILLGLATGIYTPPFEINLGQATAINPTGGIAIADFNNDGLLDFVGTNSNSSDISVLLQRG